ncbi:MAG: diguanylate cyclase [Kineosporiaceae bacterium]|jgi:two-component system cell cycle response regulator
MWLLRGAMGRLGLWMLSLGVAVGLVFPLWCVLLGLPRSQVLAPGFVTACVVAGLVVAGANIALARRVVGGRLRELSDRMHYVERAISDATFSGEWDRCTPQSCHLPVRSDDELGEAARAFNSLVTALAGSREVERRIAGLGTALSRSLETTPLATDALQIFLQAARAPAGAFVIFAGDGLRSAASVRFGTGSWCEDPQLLDALRGESPVLLKVPAGVSIQAAAVRFRPAAVALLPLHFAGTPLGAVILALDQEPAPDVMRLLTMFLAPTAVALNNALAHERFQELADRDPLTDALNRRAGLAALQERLARARRDGEPLGLLLFDIDRFKTVNDTHGHVVGDRVLKSTAAAVRRVLRADDLLIRTGGEEFLVVLGDGDAGAVRAAGQRVRAAAAEGAVQSARGRVSITVSIGGLSVCGLPAGTVEDVIHTVDSAMYAAKSAGRDRLVMDGEACAQRA